jgi:hypothetical protein
MKMAAPLIVFSLAAFGIVGVLGACTPKPQGLFAENSPPVSVSKVDGTTAPQFIGRWSTGAKTCRNPMVIQAKALHDGATDCEFAKIDNASAGYSIYAVCHAGKGSQPGRLTLTLPDPTHTRSMTLEGGPFKQPVSLERCA